MKRDECESPSEDRRWYVACGCDHHGDHLGCDERCKELGSCRHPIGVEITAATEAEADNHVHGPWCAEVPQSDIDAGRQPARKMLQIASAVRQDTAGSGARLYSLRLILDGESIYGPVDLPPGTKAALDDALDGLTRHLGRIEEKLALAIEAERG